VARTLQIDVPRLPDRDELVSSLRERGFDAQPLNRDGRCALKVSSDDGLEPMAAVEEWLAESGLPLVPERTSKRSCLLRPAGD